MIAQDPSANDKVLGVIFPDEGAFAYELLDLSFMRNWLDDRSLPEVGYRVELTPGGKASSVAICAEQSSLDLLLPAARRLADAGAGAVVWACTSASFFNGVDYAHEQANALSAESRIPATSTSLGLLAAIESLGISKLDVMMAYLPEVADRLLIFLVEAGVEVVDVKHISCGETQRPFDLDYREELTEFTRSLPGRSHPIVIPSTGLDSLDRVEEFESIAGRPVITANQVTLWHGLRLLGVRTAVPRAGSLFSRRE